MNPTTTWNAFDDNAVTRTDLFNSTFTNSLEASWMQLGRRINYPGYTNATTTFQPYGRTDGLGLIHNFIIRDSSLAPSNLENDLPVSLVNLAPTSRYDPSSAGYILNWYLLNFSFLQSEFVLRRRTSRSRCAGC